MLILVPLLIRTHSLILAVAYKSLTLTTQVLWPLLAVILVVHYNETTLTYYAIIIDNYCMLNFDMSLTIESDYSISVCTCRHGLFIKEQRT